MRTHRLHVSDARERLDEVRAELLAFTDVLEVFPTGHADMVVVICSGRPRPGEWVHALRAAGYRIPPRRHAGTVPPEPTARRINGASPSGTRRRGSPAEVRR